MSSRDTATDPSPIGVLLINLGTPDAPTPSAVRRYLREFLGDPRVLDAPAPVRFLLLNFVILPFRPRKSAEAYRKIWAETGSPLLSHGEALAREVAERLGDGFRVELAMRYGRPTLRDALARLHAAGVAQLVLAPLYPQYAASTTGSTLARCFELMRDEWDLVPVQTLPPFYDDPGFLEAWAKRTRPILDTFAPDHVLFSYHGLPESQIRKSDPGSYGCLASVDCCDVPAARARCYRAQCLQTTRGLIEAMGLEDERCSSAFQSRLGPTAWIAPSTEDQMAALAASGVKRLAIACPAFVADCLETLEEIGIRGREQWTALGGDELCVLPCPNAEPAFADAVADMVRRSVAG